MNGSPGLAALESEAIYEPSVRFRTLGCWPVTAAISSDADSIERIIAETAGSSMSERHRRVSAVDSRKAQKRQGYF